MEEASAFRIPNAPITNGANATTWAHFQGARDVRGQPQGRRDEPRTAVPAGRREPPGAASGTPPGRAAYGGGGDGGAAGGAGAAGRATNSTSASRALPFEGLRILDMTSFWAGPLTGHMLALLGAEVIHLESATRPDGARLVGGVPQTEDQYWERGPIFAALNTNKKSLTVDLSEPRGLDLVRRLIGTCDVVVENYTPRVLDQLGLDFESLREERPDLILVRMPGFGLDGPGRDLSAFAFVIEDAAGLTWLTGHPDLLPFEPYCVGDPNAGLHALYGLLLALEHRGRTGEGGLVEAAMVDAALNIAAEQPIEFSAYGALLERAGNRGPTAAPQNLYKVAGPDERGRDDGWVAIAVATDEQWSALRGALGRPGVGRRPRAGDQGRPDATRTIGSTRCWGSGAGPGRRTTSSQTLWEAGVPVGKVMQPHDQPDLPQLAARGFFEEVDHPVIGTSRYSTLPMRFSRGPERVHRRHAPLLGEHNGELLGELGLSAAEHRHARSRRDHRRHPGPGHLSVGRESRILRRWVSRKLPSTSSRPLVASGWSGGSPRPRRAWRCTPPSSAPISC